MKENQWLNWAIQLQAIAQAGLHYSKDRFDIERFQRIREISAEIINSKTQLSMEKVKDIFCCETGYQTPKIETRAVIIQENKILLVKERNNLWSIPGGWVDVNLTIRENVIKEVKEETGLDVQPEYIIAMQDSEKNNINLCGFRICKVFIMCKSLGGSFKKNIETTESKYFSLDDLPELSKDRVTKKQIEMFFKAKNSKNWTTLFD